MNMAMCVMLLSRAGPGQPVFTNPADEGDSWPGLVWKI